MASSAVENSSTVPPTAKDIFEDVYFAVIPTNDLSDAEAEKVRLRSVVYIGKSATDQGPNS